MSQAASCKQHTKTNPYETKYMRLARPTNGYLLLSTATKGADDSPPPEDF